MAGKLTMTNINIVNMTENIINITTTMNNKVRTDLSSPPCQIFFFLGSKATGLARWARVPASASL